MHAPAAARSKNYLEAVKNIMFWAIQQFNFVSVAMTQHLLWMMYPRKAETLVHFHVFSFMRHVLCCGIAAQSADDAAEDPVPVGPAAASLAAAANSTFAKLTADAVQ